MSLEIIRNDITKVSVDAIVNAANNTLLGGGGVDGAIHRAAGHKLLAECIKLGGCKTGDAKITNGYRLPAKYVIHTVGPIWHGGESNEKALLQSCYEKSLALAKEYDCKSVAFPLISAGVYGYPKEQALKVAVEAIRKFLLWNDMKVYIVLFDRELTDISRQLFENVSEYIDDVYVDEHTDYGRSVLLNTDDCCYAPKAESTPIKPRASKLTERLFGSDECDECAIPLSISELDIVVDESFSEMLLRKIDEKGMKDSDCYKKAGVDRKLFSKIRSNPEYKPSKQTVIAFALALELPIDEAREMLMKAGFALSHSNKFDIIIEYFILHNNYDLFAVNETLFEFDQPLL